MLLKSRISQIGMLQDGDYNQLWKHERLGKITSSNVWKLCQEKGWGDTGLGYIRSRVHETLSGVSSDTEINTEAAINGLVQEGPALRTYIYKNGINPQQVVVQKLIYGDDPLYCCTPDGIYCMNESTDGLSWNVEAWEVKAYGVIKHMKCIEANGDPMALKKLNRQLFYQILDQMLNVDCLTGKVILFNSELPEDKGGLHVIPFHKMHRVVDKTGKTTFPIVAELTFLKSRKEAAKKEIEQRLITA